jgi:hypothetical protein
MVRHDDAIDAGVHRGVSVLDRLDALTVSTIGPSQFSRKNAMSFHERKVPE